MPDFEKELEFSKERMREAFSVITLELELKGIEDIDVLLTHLASLQHPAFTAHAIAVIAVSFIKAYADTLSVDSKDIWREALVDWQGKWEV